jgi:ribosomal protein S17
MGLLDVLLDRTFLVSNIITTDVFSILLQTELEIMLDGYYKLTPTEARDHLISESKRVFPEKKIGCIPTRSATPEDDDRSTISMYGRAKECQADLLRPCARSTCWYCLSVFSGLPKDMFEVRTTNNLRDAAQGLFLRVGNIPMNTILGSIVRGPTNHASAESPTSSNVASEMTGLDDHFAFIRQSRKPNVAFKKGVTAPPEIRDTVYIVALRDLTNNDEILQEQPAGSCLTSNLTDPTHQQHPLEQTIQQQTQELHLSSNEKTITVVAKTNYTTHPQQQESETSATDTTPPVPQCLASNAGDTIFHQETQPSSMNEEQSQQQSQPQSQQQAQQQQQEEYSLSNSIVEEQQDPQQQETNLIGATIASLPEDGETSQSLLDDDNNQERLPLQTANESNVVSTSMIQAEANVNPSNNRRPLVIGPSLFTMGACMLKHAEDKAFLESNAWLKNEKGKNVNEPSIHCYNNQRRPFEVEWLSTSQSNRVNKLTTELLRLIPGAFTVDELPTSESEMSNHLRDYQFPNSKTKSSKDRIIAKVWNKWRELHRAINMKPTTRCELYLHDTVSTIGVEAGEEGSSATLHVKYEKRPANTSEQTMYLEEHDVSLNDLKDEFHADLVRDLRDVSNPNSHRGDFIGPTMAHHVPVKTNRHGKDWQKPISQPPPQGHGGENKLPEYHIVIGYMITYNDLVVRSRLRMRYQTVSVRCIPPNSPNDDRLSWDGRTGSDPTDGLESDITEVSREFIYTIYAGKRFHIRKLAQLERDARNEPRVPQKFWTRKNRVVIPSQTNQMIALKYVTFDKADEDGETGQWEGLFAPFNRRSVKPIQQTVTLGWLLENFTGRYLDKVKEACVLGRRRHTRIPAGDPDPSLDMNELIGVNTQIPIKFRQGTTKVCYGYAVANMMHTMKYEDLAMTIADIADTSIGCLDIEEKIRTCIREYFKSRVALGVYCIERKVPSRTNIHSLSQKQQADDINSTVVVLKLADGSVSHAVGVFNGYLFDASCSHAVELNDHNLEKVAGEPFDSIDHGMQWIIRRKSQRYDRINMSDLVGISKQFPIAYGQHRKKLAYGYALANMMQVLKHNELALNIVQTSKNVMIDLNDMEQVLSKKVKEYFYSDSCRGLDCDTRIIVSSECIMSLSTEDDDAINPAVVTLTLADGTESYAIGVYKGMIFDSRCSHAVTLTNHNLERLMGDTSQQIHHGQQWFIHLTDVPSDNVDHGQQWMIRMNNQRKRKPKQTKKSSNKQPKHE